MKNTTQSQNSTIEFLQSKYSRNLITRFDLQIELSKNLGLTINEAIKKFGAVNRRVFGIGRNKQCMFSIKEVALYIENALTQIERENISNLSIINTVIARNPLEYTILDNEIKECLVEDMEYLPKNYSVEDLEDYVIEHLPTDKQILANKYDIETSSVEEIDIFCSEFGLDTDEYLRKNKTEVIF